MPKKKDRAHAHRTCKHCGRSVSASWWLRHQQKCNPAVTTLQRATEYKAPPPVMVAPTGTYIQVPPAVLDALAPLVEQYGPIVNAGRELFEALRAAAAARKK